MEGTLNAETSTSRSAIPEISSGRETASDCAPVRAREASFYSWGRAVYLWEASCTITSSSSIGKSHLLMEKRRLKRGSAVFSYKRPCIHVQAGHLRDLLWKGHCQRLRACACAGRGWQLQGYLAYKKATLPRTQGPRQPAIAHLFAPGKSSY